jgi:metal-sulfur cluster biosynthetic enzyme
VSELSHKRVEEAISRVIDPETRLSIVMMGLVYGIQVDASIPRIKITYTLTTPLCPLAGVIQDRIRAEIAKEFPDMKVTPETVITELVFDPPWSLDRLSDEAKAELGF